MPRDERFRPRPGDRDWRFQPAEVVPPEEVALPYGRTVVVAIEDRMVIMADEDRLILVPAEDRETILKSS